MYTIKNGINVDNLKLISGNLNEVNLMSIVALRGDNDLLIVNSDTSFSDYTLELVVKLVEAVKKNRYTAVALYMKPNFSGKAAEYKKLFPRCAVVFYNDINTLRRE